MVHDPRNLAHSKMSEQAINFAETKSMSSLWEDDELSEKYH